MLDYTVPVLIEIIRIIFSVQIYKRLGHELLRSKEGRKSRIFVDCLAHRVGILRNGRHGNIIFFSFLLLDLCIFYTRQQGLLHDIQPRLAGRLGFFLFLL